MKRVGLILMGVLFCAQLFAQGEENNLLVDAQVRSRAEYRNGAFFPRDEGVDAAGFINYRSRLSVEYSRSNLALYFSGQHVGVWGQDPPIDQNGRFMLNEAWASLTPARGLFIKMGRQKLAYDDERILGGLDWNVSGRFHDALKLGYENHSNKVHLVLAFNQSGERTSGGTYYGGGQPYKSMQMLWYQYIGEKAFNISFLMMNLGLQAGTPSESESKSMQTFGTNITYQPGPFRLYGTLYFQTGKTDADRSITAFMGALNASYSINPVWRVMAATDYMSGDDQSDLNKHKAFNPLYGNHHAFYGAMDYFYASSFILGQRPGLWDNQLGVSCKASPKTTLALNVHHFQTTTDVYLIDQKLKRSLGTEVDFQVTWNVMRDVTFTGGYSTMFGNDSMKAVKGGDPSKWNDWAWISLNINPRIFVTKW
jgi:hypothetical protein